MIERGETWSLKLNREHRLRVFENRVPKKICGPRRKGVRGDWRKLRDEELYDLYSRNVIRVNKARRMR
jgi:hypothetical protein